MTKNGLLSLAAFLLVLTGTLEAGAQSSTPAVHGTVLDADSGDELPSASVAVWKLPQNAEGDTTLATGSITDNMGAFHVTGLRPGIYRVVISYVGYVTDEVENIEVARGGSDINLGEIRLSPDFASLENVDVVSERDRVEYQIDRTVYNTADDPLSQAGTATSVLENIPSIDVDIDGNVSLRGVSNVAILINGRPAPVSADFISSYLASLPAATIERVEVIPNPSARYEPDGMGGILNIVLKEEVDLGVGGALTAGGDSQGGIEANGLLTYNKGNLTLSSSYGFRRGVRDSDGDRYRINRYLDPNTTLEQDFLSERDDNSHYGSLSAEYALSENSLLIAGGQIGYSDENSDDLTTFLELDAEDDVLQDYDRLSDESENNLNGSVRLGFTHDFGTPSSTQGGGNEGMGRGRHRGHHGGRDGGGGSAGLGSHSLSIEARYSASSEEEAEFLTEENQQGTLLEQQDALNDELEQEFSFQADYVRPLSFVNNNARVEVGYRGELEHIESSFFSETFDFEQGEYVPDADLNNAFDYDRQVHALYSQFATKVGSLSIQLGLRAESALTRFTLENTGENFDNDYFSVFPSGFLLYELGQNTAIRTSYSRRIRRPRTWYLNPFPSVSDPLNIRQGNPSLKPEYVDAFEFGFIHYTGFGSLTLSPYYRRTTDVIRRFQRLREDGVTISTFENLDSNDSYGVELIASLRAGSLRGNVSVEGYQVITDGSNVDTELENNAFGWGGRANLNYTIRQGLDAQVSFRYRAPMNTEQGRSGSRSHVNLGLRQRFLNDRASLSLRVRDPFDSGGFSFTLDQPDLYQEFERSWGGREIGLTFTYAFGKQEDRRDQQRPEVDGGGEFDGISLDG